MRLRAIVRSSSHYILDYVRVLARHFGHDVITGLVFVATADANVGYLDQPLATARRYDVLDAPPPDAMRRPIRPHKLALSLGLPRETARRKVAALVSQGWLVETDQGVIAPTAALDSPGFRQALIENSNLVFDLLRELRRFGLDAAPLPPEGPEAIIPHRAIARITAGYCLRSFDELRAIFDGDLTMGLISAAVTDANVGHLNSLPGPPYAELDDHVPDSERRPISALALAGELNLPRETVRRYVRKLEAVEAVRTVRGGLITPQSTLRRPEVLAATARNGANLRQLLTELHPPLAPFQTAENAGRRQSSG